MASASGSTTDPQQSTPPQRRVGNAEHFFRMKQEILKIPTQKKLLKFASYSKCQASQCACVGWRNLKFPLNTRKFEDPCGNSNCGHSVDLHIAHIKNQSEVELNRIMSMIFDLENLHLRFKEEKQMEVKKLYSNLFKVCMERNETCPTA